ncbi:hypothetical protein AVEN_57831-1 [Araneus ventricosus]|uniref:Uncharacterized protein n=1 Tax=Araneus ventricosus TaxID=182803 RepID=A0A4Y2I8T5_ARAVE|nr:hypothetical protein AVEN_57831-1 [Araneus ventricosus]
MLLCNLLAPSLLYSYLSSRCESKCVIGSPTCRLSNRDMLRIPIFLACTLMVFMIDFQFKQLTEGNISRRECRKYRPRASVQASHFQQMAFRILWKIPDKIRSFRKLLKFVQQVPWHCKDGWDAIAP